MEQTLQKEHFNLSEVVNTTVESMARKAEEKEIVLDTNTSYEGCYISGDPHLLERAITNLLENALRHTPNKGKVTIDLQRVLEEPHLGSQSQGVSFVRMEGIYWLKIHQMEERYSQAGFH